MVVVFCWSAGELPTGAVTVVVGHCGFFFFGNTSQPICRTTLVFIKTYLDDGLHGGILSESDNAVNQVTIRIAKLEIAILKLSIECPGKLQ